jgi:hypothetical protein
MGAAAGAPASDAAAPALPNMRPSRLLPFAPLLCAALWGCGSSAPEPLPTRFGQAAYVRAVNLREAPLTVRFGDQQSRPLPVGTASVFQRFPPRPLRIQAEAPDTPPFEQDQDLRTAGTYTLYAYRIGAEDRMRIVEGDPREADQGRAMIRLANLGASETVRIRLSGPEAAADPVALSPEEFGESAEIAMGTWTIDATTHDGRSLASAETELEEGGAYTVVLFRQGDDLRLLVVHNNPRMHMTGPSGAS